MQDFFTSVHRQIVALKITLTNLTQSRGNLGNHPALAILAEFDSVEHGVLGIYCTGYQRDIHKISLKSLRLVFKFLQEIV